MDEQELEDAEIWVPEPVVWEWAEHAYKKMQRMFVPEEASDEALRIMAAVDNDEPSA